VDDVFIKMWAKLELNHRQYWYCQPCVYVICMHVSNVGQKLTF